MNKIALVSLGCAKNLVDSEVMLGVLKKAGWSFVPRLHEADVVVINTCGFIQPARDEARREIARAVRAKKADRSKIIVVTGCWVQRNEDDLRAEFPEVDLWSGVSDFGRIDRLIKGAAPVRRGPAFLYDDCSPRVVSTPPTWAYVKVSEGCSHRCGFCAIPLIKGPYVSRPAGSVVREVRKLAALGIREIDLISQDTTWYGRDRGKRDGLAGLLGRIIKTGSARWLRILYGYPGEISDALLEVMQDPAICRYLDIPVQHSHPRVIKTMKRGLDGRRALDLLNRIRRRLPGAAVRTSLIVGFPGEGREEFRDLMDFVREARFEHLGVFAYSPEPGTSAYALGDPVPPAEKEARRREIMALQAGISREINRSYVGRTIEALIEGIDAKNPGTYLARSRCQAPEVDGLILLKTQSSPADALVPVRITSAGVHDLKGKPAHEK